MACFHDWMWTSECVLVNTPCACRAVQMRLMYVCVCAMCACACVMELIMPSELGKIEETERWGGGGGGGKRG